MTLRCEWCGAKLKRRSRGPAPRYCNGACRQAAFRLRHRQEPASPEEWQQAVDSARVCLLIDSARLYGLVATTFVVNAERCDEILGRGAEMAITPRPDEILLAEMLRPA